MQVLARRVLTFLRSFYACSQKYKKVWHFLRKTLDIWDLKSVADEINDRIYLLTSRREPYSIAILNSYLYFKEREIERIITTLESIRYGVKIS